jgi:transposase
VLLLAQTIRHDFEQGVVWNGQDVLNWVKRHCKKDLHKPRAYELLQAIGFSLQAPRPRHEKSNPAEVEDFKKRSFRTPSKRLRSLLMKLKPGSVTNTVSG